MVLEHGTRSRYTGTSAHPPCRCRLCTDAQADWSREYQRRVRREAQAYRQLVKAMEEAKRHV